jgi:chemotaxis protein histidine kinase CheA
MRIRSNMDLLSEALVDGYGQLFADEAQIVLKATDDLKALITIRISNEKQRVEADRERIRAEEQAKAEREAAAKVKAEQEAAEAKARQEEGERLLAAALAQTPAPIAAAPQVVAAAPNIAQPAANTSSVPTLTLGNLGKRLGFDVRADFLLALGFKGQKERAATLYFESDFPRICAALISHIQSVSQLQAAA